MARNPRRPSNREHARRRTAERHAAELNSMLRATAAGTAEHSHAVERLALRIADHLGLDGELRRTVGLAARLHDIGKYAIPSSVLEKNAPLSPYEWEMMRDHTVFGEEILRGGSDMDAVARYVRHAHERWDGKGYPDGLAGEQIPLVSRIIFCADAYDAICTDRPYRRGASPAEGLAEIRSCSGTQFDPRVVDALARALRPELYRRSGRVRHRRHARLLSAMAVFLIGAIGTAAAAVTSESGPSLAGPSQVRSAPANALSSARPGALTPPIPSSPGQGQPGRARRPHRPSPAQIVPAVTEPTRRPVVRVPEPTRDRELEWGSKAVPPRPRPPLEPPATPPSWRAAVQRPRRRPPCRTRFRFFPCPTRPRSWTTYRASRANPAGADSAQRTPAVS